MSKIILTLIIAGFIILLNSCNKQQSQNSTHKFSDGELIADTIFYPVRIKNIDKEDEWADVRLKKLNSKKLVDDIFASVYSGNATAYHYLTDETLSIDRIKELESSEAFTRENVIELEFREKWWYNNDKSLFKKEVLSILVAYAVMDDNKELPRLRAAFYVKMNNQ